MCQCGQSPEQVLFREILLRSRNGHTTISDWDHLMQQTPRLDDVTLFENAVHLQSNLLQNIISLNRPVATIKAVNSGPNATKASSDDAGV